MGKNIKCNEHQQALANLGRQYDIIKADPDPIPKIGG